MAMSGEQKFTGDEVARQPRLKDLSDQESVVLCETTRSVWILHRAPRGCDSMRTVDGTAHTAWDTKAQSLSVRFGPDNSMAHYYTLWNFLHGMFLMTNMIYLFILNFTWKLIRT